MTCRSQTCSRIAEILRRPKLYHGSCESSPQEELLVWVQGQKVNYNVNQMMKKAWKRQDGPTSMRVPADAVYPAEDDYTESLLNIQSRNPEDSTGTVYHSLGIFLLTRGFSIPQLHFDQNPHSIGTQVVPGTRQYQSHHLLARTYLLHVRHAVKPGRCRGTRKLASALLRNQRRLSEMLS